MRHIPVEAFEDTTRPNGGFVVVVLHGVDHPSGATSVRLKPLEAGSLAERQTAQRLGRITPVLTRLSDRGLEVVLGPEVAGNPLLLAGTAVAIEVAGPEVRGEFLWPNVAPPHLPKRRNTVVPARSRPRRKTAGTGTGTGSGTAIERPLSDRPVRAAQGTDGTDALHAPATAGPPSTARNGHDHDTQQSVVLEGIIEMPLRRGAGTIAQAAARMRGIEPGIDARAVGAGNEATSGHAKEWPRESAKDGAAIIAKGAVRDPARDDGAAAGADAARSAKVNGMHVLDGSDHVADAEARDGAGANATLTDPVPVPLRPVEDPHPTREAEPASARGRRSARSSQSARSETAAARGKGFSRALAASLAIVGAAGAAWYYQASDWDRAALPEAMSQQADRVITASREWFGGTGAGPSSMQTGSQPPAQSGASSAGQSTGTGGNSGSNNAAGGALRPASATTAAAPAAAAVAPLACETPAITTEPMQGGRAMLKIAAPCRRSEPLRIAYGGVAQTLMLDARGQAAATIDLFAGENSPIQVTFADGLRESRLVSGTDLDRLSKIALIWKSPVNLDLHVFEYAARRGEPGHVWSRAGSSFAQAASETTLKRRGHGFMSVMADGTTAGGDQIEVYTFLHGQEPALGALALAIDYESRGDSPSDRFCGKGALAEVGFRLIARTRAGLTEESQGVLAAAACGAKLASQDRLVPVALSARLRR